MITKFKDTPYYQILVDKLKSAPIIKLNGAYLIDVGNELALQLMEFGFDIRGYNAIDFCFDSDSYEDNKTEYERALEYSKTGKLYICHLCIHNISVGDSFIPTDNSYNVNLTTGKEHNRIVPETEYDEYYRQDMDEMGAKYTVVKDPYFELNPTWDWGGIPAKGDELLMFTHIKSDKTNYIYKCMVSQYV